MQMNFIGGKAVILRVSKKDRYGRLIATIWLDNQNINLWLVEQGHAWRYERYSKSMLYQDAQEQAQSKKLGLWSQDNPMAPWVFRKIKN